MPVADPDPSRSTGLEPGGGVPPGETPPDAGSVAQQGHADDASPRSWTPWLWIAGISIPAVLVALLLFVEGVLRIS